MSYHENLRIKADLFAHKVYKVTKSFPKDEMYGLTSQLRRASVSVVLNSIEGYARFKTKVHKNFTEIAYGSLQESKYLINFCHQESLIQDSDYKELTNLGEEIGAMLWGIIRKL
jgi:four helix bundle protein